MQTFCVFRPMFSAFRSASRNMEESAKHQAWSGLGDMSPMEAMRLFVRTLEEEQVSTFVPNPFDPLFMTCHTLRNRSATESACQQLMH